MLNYLFGESGATLYEAIESGDAEAVVRITSSKFPPSFEAIKKAGSESNLLILAEDNVEILECILNKYRDDIVNRKNEYIGNALEAAGANGYYDAVKFLIKDYSDEIRSQELSATYMYAIENSHIRIVKLLLSKFNKKDLYSDPYSEGNAVFCAGETGNRELIKAVLKNVGINTKRECFANRRSMSENLQLADLLLKDCGSKIRASMKEDVFNDAIAYGDYPLAEFLLNSCGDDISPESKIAAFKEAGRDNAEDLIELLITSHGDDIPAVEKTALFGNRMLYAGMFNDDGFMHDIQKRDRCIRMAEFLLEHCGDDISVEEKTRAFYRAVNEKIPEMLTVVLEHAGDAISPYDRYSALRNAIEDGDLDRLLFLLDYEGIRGHVTRDNNMLLRLAETSAEQDEENYQPIIDVLLAIPEVAALETEREETQPEARQQENERQGDSDSVPFLSQFLRIFERVERIGQGLDRIQEGVRNSQSSSSSSSQQDGELRDLSNFSESAMGSLTSAEKAIIRHLERHYGDYVKNVDWDDIHASMIDWLVEAYEKNPVMCHGEELPLEYTSGLTLEQNRAYFGHSIHTAWRYLSGENPWMSPNARYVNGNAAIISDEDKKIMSLLWVALSDETIPLEKTFTVEGNKNIFFDTIASIARGHNRDERRINPHDPHDDRVTTADDQDYDNPSCSWGVKKSLFQAAYGHPHINCPEAQPLSVEIMLSRMVELLVKRKETSYHNIIERMEEILLNKEKESADKILTQLKSLIDENLTDTNFIKRKENGEYSVQVVEQIAQLIQRKKRNESAIEVIEKIKILIRLTDNIVDRLDGLSLAELEQVRDHLIDAVSGLEMSEKQEKIFTLDIPQEKLRNFIERSKLWFGAEAMTKQQTLKPNSMGTDGYSQHECHNYVELIQFFAENPEQAFGMHLMNDYLQERIAFLQQQQSQPQQQQNAVLEQNPAPVVTSGYNFRRRQAASSSSSSSMQGEARDRKRKPDDAEGASSKRRKRQ